MSANGKRFKCPGCKALSHEQEKQPLCKRCGGKLIPLKKYIKRYVNPASHPSCPFCEAPELIRLSAGSRSFFGLIGPHWECQKCKVRF